uniref:Uncharacterized protein AlNc14C107G6260 n=1 Tax=Albugo laibachii Nc14 TaxID=890382 RepID=F0WI53_9STRA|nr:conserved hypothetical protein [Albugo laibachii Nc14]|eukprot:CCA20931.1 conserved hypothetical protein [Albugo laibachii Nc14]
MSKRHLFVELNSVRDLYPLPISLTDVYAVIQLHSHCNNAEKYNVSDCSNCYSIRSDTISISSQEYIKFKFRHIFELENFNCEKAIDGFISVQLLHECSFCFDMFSGKEDRSVGYMDGRKQCKELRGNADTLSEQMLSNSCDSISSQITQSCSYSSLCSMETNQREVPGECESGMTVGQEPSLLMQKSKGVMDYDVEADSVRAGDRKIGAMQVSLAQSCSPHDPVRDQWYCITNPLNGGQLRLRTIFCGGSATCPNERQIISLESVLTKTERKKMFKRFLYEASPMFECDLDKTKEKEMKYSHLNSYAECREKQRKAIWREAFGYPEEFSEKWREIRLREPESKLCRDLARNVGIPKQWRPSVYAYCIEQKRLSECPNYYRDLLEKVDALDSIAFRQIELDVNRTFSTKKFMRNGRAALRRVLQAYSIRNVAIGYCQGLNFIVAFLLEDFEEEMIFWLLALICEDIFPRYYIPTMVDTQTDMRVLNEIVAEHLPDLDEFSMDVDLPLELLGSQWLLCLFTTTFPSKTVYRILDWLLVEGSFVVFPVILHHLRLIQPKLLVAHDFQRALFCIKEAERLTLDSDAFMYGALNEADHLPKEVVESLRTQHRTLVNSELRRGDRTRAINRHVASACQVPAFSTYAAGLLHFFHQGSDDSRTEFAVMFSLLCHSLSWLTEQSRRLRGQ